MNPYPLSLFLTCLMRVLTLLISPNGVDQHKNTYPQISITFSLGATIIGGVVSQG